MIFTLNRITKTISMHKDTCESVKEKIGDINLSAYSNGYYTGEKGNQVWFAEEHFTIEKAKAFFGGDYCKVFCQQCF